MMSNDRFEMKLELVPVPVGDIDRTKDFYVEKLGFDVDVDVEPGGDVSVVQLTNTWTLQEMPWRSRTGPNPDEIG
jgi:catechol 2,3-dioxygenase-like lactoylglutathione lyase family enzyme